MDKNEIIINDNLKSYEAPPVAFNINALNLAKIKNYKIIKNKTLAIIHELSNLKIDISHEILKSLDKNILLDIIIYIQNYCRISLLSNIFIFNNSNLEINKNNNNPNEYLMMLKNKSSNEKIESEKKVEYYCLNHNRYFKSNDALQNHYRAAHKFKCEKCGVYHSSKTKLEKHIVSHNHQILKNNNNLNKENNFINIINYPNNNNIILNDNNEIKNNEPKKVNKLTMLFEKLDNELKNKKNKGKRIKKDLIQKKNELKKQEQLKKLEEERKRREEELKKKEEELKRKEEELKLKEEERKRKEEESKRLEELKQQEELRKKDEIKKMKENKANSNKDYFYECYLDNKKFDSEKEYINHFSKYHSKDYPFYCDKCKRGFYSFQAIENHNFSKNH